MAEDTEKTMKSIESYFSILGKVLSDEEQKALEKSDITRLALCPRGLNESDGGVAGGLVSFSLEVALTGKSMADFYDVDPKSIVKVSLFHELGRMGHLYDESLALYLDQESTWHQERLGQYYKYNEACPRMNVGHRTLWMLNDLGIKLEYEEWVAIAVSQGLHLSENAFYGGSKLPKLALLLQSARNIVLNS